MDLGEPEMIRCPMCRHWYEALSEDIGSYRCPVCPKEDRETKKPLDIAIEKLEAAFLKEVQGK